MTKRNDPPRTANRSGDPFARIRRAGTAAPNYDLDTADIIARLTKWQSLCAFIVTRAEPDAVEIAFTTLPADMDAFARELYDFCPDLVDQGTGCVREMLETMDDPSPETKALIEGVDFDDEDYGVEILKREVQREKGVTLWWD
jgi:hypothetical protein